MVVATTTAVGTQLPTRTQLDEVSVTPLLATVAHATGDLDLLRAEWRPDPTQLIVPGAGLSEEAMAAARDAAHAALVAWDERGRPAPPHFDERRRAAVLAFVTAGSTDADDDLLHYLDEELALEGADLRAPRWRLDEVAPGRELSVLVVGAGMSGLVVGHRLQQAGVPFEIVDTQPEVGGTWLANTYPGCRVDVGSHQYSYSFAQRSDWGQPFSAQPVLLDYFRTCADELGLRPHIRFETTVESARWDEATGEWVVQLRTGDGPVEERRTNVLVSAVGQLNRPSFPEIPGRERFAGPSFHSARWDHDVDLTGKRVAVIGTGASAAQFIPAIVDRVGSLVVFQRTPPWLLPTEGYSADHPTGVAALLDVLPDHARWDRAWTCFVTQEGLLPVATVDPEWDGGGQSVSAENAAYRELFALYIRSLFPEPELAEAAMPWYPPFAKRFVRDDGQWARALRHEHTTLVTAPITEITETDVRTAEGDHEVDVVIYGTGFAASDFLTPMEVAGVDGQDLHERWGGDSQAHLGMTVPGFPNLFLCYGPNTNIVVNGSIIHFSECSATYITESVHLLAEQGAKAMECTTEAHDAHNERVDEANRLRAWGASTVNTWYRNQAGRISQNWPFDLLEYWRATKAPDPDEYELR